MPEMQIRQNMKNEVLNRKQSPAFHQVTQIQFPAVKSGNLSNGIPYYIIAGGSQEVVKIDMVYKAGSAYTNQKLIAPFTNQMLHEGTKNHTSKQIADAFDFYGAYFQPAAEKDHAMINLTCLTKHLPNLSGLLAEILTETTFPQHELDILIEKRRQNFLIEQEKTAFLAREAFFEQLFGEKHPYGMATRIEYYSQMQQQELISFYGDHYHAGSCFLILSGQVTDLELRLIDATLGQMPVRKTPESLTGFALINPNTDVHLIQKEDAVQSSIRMGLKTVNKLHHDYLGLKVLTTILGGYFGSRLMKNIREEKGYTYGIHAMQVALINDGYMGIAADVKAGHTRDTIEEVKKEVQKLKDQLVSEDELALVRNFMMGDMLQMFDGPLTTADTFKSAMEFGLGFDYFEQMKNTILNITAKELQQLANTYFHFDKMVTVVAGILE